MCCNLNNCAITPCILALKERLCNIDYGITRLAPRKATALRSLYNDCNHGAGGSNYSHFRCTAYARQYNLVTKGHFPQKRTLWYHPYNLLSCSNRLPLATWNTHQFLWMSSIATCCGLHRHPSCIHFTSTYDFSSTISMEISSLSLPLQWTFIGTKYQYLENPPEDWLHPLIEQIYIAVATYVGILGWTALICIGFTLLRLYVPTSRAHAARGLLDDPLFASPDLLATFKGPQYIQDRERKHAWRRHERAG